jgi:hypothetical protein
MVREQGISSNGKISEITKETTVMQRRVNSIPLAVGVRSVQWKKFPFRTANLI